MMGPRVAPRIERVSANDRTTLATDHGPAPMNIGAVLIVEKGGILDFSTVRSLLRSRLARVRRMRQRLLPTPFGCGGPLWVDDPRFDLDRHLRCTALPEATGTADGQAPLADDRLLRVAADLACTPLPREKALWTALWVTGLADDRAALILVMHHAMTDGVGGLAVLTALGDDGVDRATDTFPEACPSLQAATGQAWRARAMHLTGILSRLSVGRPGVREIGLGRHAPGLAARTSLNRPTGTGRRLTTLDVPLARLTDVAHSRGCTVNDIILTAVAGAMAEALNPTRGAADRAGHLGAGLPPTGRHRRRGRQPDRGRPDQDPDPA